MAINILVGDAGGNILGEVPLLHIEQVVWRNNGVGQTTATLPLLNLTRYEPLLRFGNTVLLQFDNGLPNWGGIVDTPRSWQAGFFQVNLYSGEQLLEQRLTGKNEIYRQYSVGDLFRSAVVAANARAHTGVEAATPWYGGDLQDLDLHFKPLLDLATELTGDLSTADFYVTPAESDGRITFTAYLVNRRGADLYGVSLVEGRNLAEVTMEEQGPIVNYWYTVGSGTSWYTNRYVAESYDLESISAYGRRESSEIQTSISSPTMLDSIGERSLEDTANPRTAVTLLAISTPPALFSQYDIGDSLPVSIPSYGFQGFDTRVRLLGREYLPDAGLCNLLVEEFVV
ncbi:MAG: hypothetical protein KC441_02415 [Anaerolineales bacterium]|nr:hypothetical protein [Anaerolineales bacterium]